MAGLTYIIKADLSQFRTAMQNVAKSTAKVGKQMQSVGKSMSTYVTAPILAMGVGIIKTAGDFEKSMNKVAALSGATGKELDNLTMLAREMGASTQFSASQAADALGFLAMAGFNTADQMKALPNVLNLAAAASIDLASAADITSNIMSGYGKSAEDLASINDSLVKTFTSTNTSLTMLGESFTEVGPVAAGLGIEFSEASAAIGLLGNAGIQGSKAGTVLKNALVNLVNPSRKQMDVMKKLGLQIDETSIKNKGLSDVMTQLETSGASTSDMMQLFGKIAGPGMVALVSQGSAAMEGLTAEINMAGGVAEDVAKKQMQGFNGSMLTLKSAFEEVQLAIASSGLLDWVTSLVKKLTGFLSFIGKLNPELLKWGTVIAGVVAAIGPLVLIVGTFMTMLPTITAGISALSLAFNSLSLPILGIIAGVAALVAGGIYLADNWDAVSERMAVIWSKIKNAVIDGIIGAINALTFFHRAAADALGINILGDGIDWVKDKLKSLKEPIPEVTTEFGSFGDAITNVMGSVTPAMEKATDSTTAAANTMETDLGRIETAAVKAADSIRKIEPLPEMTTQSVRDLKLAVDETVPSLGVYEEHFAKVKQTTEDTSESTIDATGMIKGAIQGMATQSLIHMGEMIGGMMAGTKSFMNFGANILAIISDFMRSLGEQMIASATAMIALNAIALNPFASLAAGVVLVGVASAMSNKMNKEKQMPAFANGGLVFGPTMGLVGEGSGTTMSNPEVIAPLDKLKGFLGDAAGNGVTDNITVSGVLRGEDIYLSNKLGAQAYANLQG